jgi:hypothetical protein
MTADLAEKERFERTNQNPVTQTVYYRLRKNDSCVQLSPHLINTKSIYLSSSPLLSSRLSFIFSLKVSQAGSATCTACTAGTYPDHNTNNCVPCPANTYARAQSDVCTPCPVSMYSALGDVKCRKCLKGYKLNAERNGCQLVNPVGTPCTPPPTTIPTTPPPTRPPTCPPSLSSRPSSLPSGKTLSSQRCRAVTRK